MAVISRIYGVGRGWQAAFDWSATTDTGGGDAPFVTGGYGLAYTDTNWGNSITAVLSSLPAPNSLPFTDRGVAAAQAEPAHDAARRFWHSFATIRDASVLFSTQIVDIIPGVDSAETVQNAEPSLAVNPLDPNEILVGAFGSFAAGGMLATPYFLSSNGGLAWADYASLNTADKSLAWAADGSAFLTATLVLRQRRFTDIHTFSGTPSSGGFGSEINIFQPQSADSLDQPWIRTGPSNHVYIAYNNLNNVASGGMTASVNVSTDGGVTQTPVVIERQTAGAGQDAPAVRLAVNGSTVYAAFTRWNSTIENDANGERFASQIVVVRSDNGGADSFTALGAGGIGTVVASPTGLFANKTDTPLTLGQERTGSDMAIAVDPNNPNRVVVAYSDAPGANGAGILQLVVAESTDGGTTWSTKFTTDAATRSAQPGLALSSDGTIGFLYNNYDPTTDMLSQHLVQTSDDFATFSDTLVAAETNATPVATFSPYLGDFFDLESIGTTFYGIFSASNADNGTDAQFLDGTGFQRDFTGTPGSADFQLTDGSGNNVTASIDPFFFVSSETPCFLRGTLILTDRGEVLVEELAIGDRVVTANGELRPVRWIGRRGYAERFAVNNQRVLPIRVAAGALADDTPVRDLFVSPEHALFIDGALIPAVHLVNGATIAQVANAGDIEYFHVELDEHDILFANGAPAESYAECDNRLMFANGLEYIELYPEDARPAWQFCAPRLDAAAAALAPIRAALLDRAILLGHSLTADPDLRLVVHGETVRPSSFADGVYSFDLPAGATAAWLASRSAVPAESCPANDDRRRLGVPVSYIELRTAEMTIAGSHAHPALRDGFHEDEGTHRWTDGLGRIPSAWLAACGGAAILEIHLAPSGLAYWQMEAGDDALGIAAGS